MQFEVEDRIRDRDDISAREISARMTLMDEFLKDLDDGLGEPVQVAYTLYLKYMEYMSNTLGSQASYMFEIMADEAGYLIDYFTEACY